GSKTTGTDAEGPQSPETRGRGAHTNPTGPASTETPRSRSAGAAPRQTLQPHHGPAACSTLPRRRDQAAPLGSEGHEPPPPGPDRSPQPAETYLQWRHTGKYQGLCPDEPEPPPRETTRPPCQTPRQRRAPSPPRGGRGTRTSGQAGEEEEEGSRAGKDRGPQDIQKSVLKGIINSLLREWKGPRTKDDLRAYFILVQNPQYSSTSTYVIYAHLLRQIAALSEADHHFLVHWLKKLSARRFRQLVERLLQFISTRLFPAEPDELPPLTKCSWWIPSATKVLSLFNAANSVSSPPIMPFTDFYNITLEHIDFMEEYRTWQNYGNSNRFSFCQFPFILSTVVKKAIIQKDSEQQMISQARQSLVSKVSRRQRVDMNLLFLNIKVRRAQLLSDSLDELTRKRCDLKKKLRVTFVGEAGLDMGGLTKEWFLLLVRQIFHTDYGMFTYMKDSRCHWFSSWKCDNYSEFQLVGTLMGLAVYNSIALDIHFPLYCYRKLLTPPTAPCDQNALVGMATATLDDLQQIMPELAHGFGELLSYEGNVEEDFYLTFQVRCTDACCLCVFRCFRRRWAVVRSYNLKPGGDKIPVTKQNRKGESTVGTSIETASESKKCAATCFLLCDPDSNRVELLRNSGGMNTSSHGAIRQLCLHPPWIVLHSLTFYPSLWLPA
uniref:HECT-type E3 ubiquitin transferase n=1 Tax=Amphiprion percula TaxID=161767 RepID=A0A3P8T3B2_AMPPE